MQERGVDEATVYLETEPVFDLPKVGESVYLKKIIVYPPTTFTEGDTPSDENWLSTRMLAFASALPDPSDRRRWESSRRVKLHRLHEALHMDCSKVGVICSIVGPVTFLGVDREDEK